MDDDISGFAEHGCGIGDNGHAPRCVRRADHFAEIAAGFCGIFINCADNFDGAFFTKQADDGGSDGADSILNGANFLFLQSVVTYFLNNFLQNISRRGSKCPEWRSRAIDLMVALT